MGPESAIPGLSLYVTMAVGTEYECHLYWINLWTFLYCVKKFWKYGKDKRNNSENSALLIGILL